MCSSDGKSPDPVWSRNNDALKDARAVVQNVRHHVHARVVPLDELAIVPDDVANAWSCYVFRFASFENMLFTPSGDHLRTGARECLHRLNGAEQFTGTRKSGLSERALSGYRTGHNTVDLPSLCKARLLRRNWA